MRPGAKTKIGLFVVFAVALDMVLHGVVPLLAPEAGQSGNSLPPSALVALGLTFPAIIVYLALAFGVLAAVFSRVVTELPYSRRLAGVLYGLSFAGVWFIGVLESHLVLGTALAYELVMGLADALPILVLGVLMGACVVQTRHYRTSGAPRTLLAVPCIALFYLAGRYLAYVGLDIDSGLASDPWGTLIWTAGMGLWVGVVYRLLGPGLRSGSALRRSLLFGCVVFGTDWFLFNFFLTVVFDMNVLDLATRVFIDVLFVTAGVFVVEKWLPGPVNVGPSAGESLTRDSR